MRRAFSLCLSAAIMLLYLTSCAQTCNIDPTIYSHELEKMEAEPFQSFFIGGSTDIVYMPIDEIVEIVTQQTYCNAVTIPISWGVVEASKDIYNFEAYQNIISRIIENGKKIILVIDIGGRGLTLNGEVVVNSIPDWFFKEFPAAQAVNFYNEPINALDLSASDGKSEILEFCQRTVRWAKDLYGGSIVGFAPGIMSEFEIKLMNKEYKWEPYTVNALHMFQEFLREKYGTIEQLNSANNMDLKSFDEVVFPVVDYNTSVLSLGSERDCLYTDMMIFREDLIYNFLSDITEVIHEEGAITVGYFGQFMFPLDAIYATGVAQKCSDIIDIAVIDYNFFDGYKETYNVYIPAFLTNLMSNIGYDKVITGLYFERVDLDNNNTDFLEKTIEHIKIDAHSYGIEVGSLSPKYAEYFNFTSSINVQKSKIALYVSEWNFYKTHGEYEEYINYLSDAAVELYRDLEFELGIPVEIITDINVLRGELNEFEIVIIPTQIYVDEQVKLAILEYGNGGGKIIQDFRFGEFDSYGYSKGDWGDKLFCIDAKSATDQRIELYYDDQKFSIYSTYKHLPSYYLTESLSEVDHLLSDGQSNIGIATNSTIVWGFQPQLLYRSSENKVYLKFINDSILRLQNSEQ